MSTSSNKQTHRHSSSRPGGLFGANRPHQYHPPHIVISNGYNLYAPVTLGYVFSIIGFAVIFSLILGAFTPAFFSIPMGMPARLSWLQALSTLFVFFLPAWLIEFYFRRKNFTFLYRWRSDTLSTRQILLGIAIMLCILPLAYGLTYLSEQYLHLNDLLPFGDRLREIEENSNHSLRIMLSDRSIWGTIRSILIIGVLTPIAEELLMRGALQGWLLAKTRRVHLSVWIIAFIFSLIHMQADGFLARLIMGAVLGYIAAYGSLWLAMIVHGINNLFAYIEYLSTGYVNTTQGFGEALEISVVTMIIIVIIGAVLAYLCINRMRQLCAAAQPITEGNDNSFENV